MAGNKEIKHTIRLDGEKEYSQAIREAQRNLRTLRSELKAETAELGANATAQQKNEARAKSLKAQIAEQEKVVETLKKALNEAKRDYGDNEDVVQKWEQKLNDARTTLANMQNGLSETENAMRGASSATAEGVTATKSFADALGSIASAGESVSGAIEGIFTDMISGVRDAVVELWGAISDTAAKANNWSDIAGYWNTDPANVEKWARAVEASSNSFSDLENVVTRINLGGKGKEITEMLGVSDVNYSSQWDYAMAVMDRISELSQSGNLPENLWETIFGEKKSTKVMDLVNDWDTIREGLTTFDADNGGFGMGAEDLQTMNDLDVQISTIEQKWIALKDQMTEGFGTISADLLVNVSGGLDALNEYFNADSEAAREAALAKFRKNITEFFRKVGKAIRVALEQLSQVGDELSRSDDPVVSAIGNLMKKLTAALSWIVNHQEEVKGAFEAIFGVWFLAKLAMVSGKLASIVAQIEVIKGFKGLSTGTAVAEGAAAEGAAASGGGAAAAGGGALVAKAGVLAGTAYMFAKGAEYRREYGPIGSEDAIEAGTHQSDELRDAFIEFVDSQAELQKLIEDGGAYTDQQAEEIANRATAASENLYSFDDATNLMHLYSDWRDAQGLGNMDWQLPGNMIDVEKLVNDSTGAVLDKAETLLGGGTNQNGVQTGLSSEDAGFFKGLPGLLRQALFGHIGSLKVTMDGQEVGRIVTPYVSANIARDATQ